MRCSYEGPKDVTIASVLPHLRGAPPTTVSDLSGCPPEVAPSIYLCIHSKNHSAGSSRHRFTLLLWFGTAARISAALQARFDIAAEDLARRNHHVIYIPTILENSTVVPRLPRPPISCPRPT